MNSEIRKLLESVQAGETSVDDAMLELKKAPFEDIGYAKVDLHRKVRQGAAEVIYGAGKTPEQIGGIIDAMRANGQNRVLITRMSPEAAAYVGSTRELDYMAVHKASIAAQLKDPETGNLHLHNLKYTAKDAVNLLLVKTKERDSGTTRPEEE